MKKKSFPKIKAVNTLKMSESGKLTLNGSPISTSELLIIANLMANVCDDKKIGTDKVEFLNAWIDNHQNPSK